MSDGRGRPSLFATATRSPGPRSRRESVWQFLERSSQPEAAAARTQWDDWLRRMPQGPRDALITRLRARDERQVRAALAELVTYVLLDAASPVVHVDLETESGSHTDFAVNVPVRTHLEVHRTTLAESAFKDARRQQDIAEEIEKIDSPDFWLSVDVQAGAQISGDGKDQAGSRGVARLPRLRHGTASRRGGSASPPRARRQWHK